MILHLGGSKLSENGWRLACFGAGVRPSRFGDGDIRGDERVPHWSMPGEGKSLYGGTDTKLTLCGAPGRADSSPVLLPMLSVCASKAGAVVWEGSWTGLLGTSWLLGERSMIPSKPSEEWELKP